MVLQPGCGIRAREIVLSFELVAGCALCTLLLVVSEIVRSREGSHSQRKLFAILGEMFLCLNANSLKAVSQCCGALFYF
jgi:hypothetical protein